MNLKLSETPNHPGCQLVLLHYAESVSE